MRRSALIAACVLAACGEPATMPGTDAGPDPLICARNADCSDDLFCNGEELCAPDDPAASARGCIAAMSAPCTGACDEAANRCDTSTCETVDVDADGDGADSIVCGGLDCDDSSAAVHPGATEVCDPDDLDEDCDPTTYGARDRDGDGVDDAECCNGSTCGLDCDDTRAGVSPIAPEVCDTIDNDCDDLIDEGVVLGCYLDADHDRYAAAGATMTRACDCPVGTTAMPPAGTDVDCNDALPDVSPGSPEICSNSRDDDCDDTVDEAGNDWYRDCDGDSYGAGTPVRACTSPGVPAGCPAGNHVLTTGDCDDAIASIHPGGGEVCDGIDQDCDAQIDEGAPEDTAPDGWCPLAITAGVERTCALRSSGLVSCWGEGSARPSTLLTVTGARGISLDQYAGTLCARTATGIVCERELGSFPITDATDIASGGGFACAVRAANEVWCWGDNTFGQLGFGSTAVESLEPVRASGLVDAVEVVVGTQHACARLATGAVWCWGDNGRGQLHDGTGLRRSSPVESLFGGAISIAAVGERTCALDGAGMVSCTDGLSGEVFPGAVEIGSGADYACVRLGSGVVSCWGADAYGQLGNGAGADGSVVGIATATAIATGARHACAIWGPTPHVSCWGDNRQGQLGDGTMTNRIAPVPVVP